MSWEHTQIIGIVLLCSWGPKGFIEVPELLHSNGGFVFGLPCLVLFLLVYYPVLLLQIRLGAVWQQNMVQIFSTKLPIATGIGIACIIRAGLAIVTSVPRLSVAVYYLLQVLGGTLPYWGCYHEWNSPLCCELPVYVSRNHTLACYKNKVLEVSDVDAQRDTHMVPHLIWTHILSCGLLFILIAPNANGFGWACVLLSLLLLTSIIIMYGYVYSTLPIQWLVLTQVYLPHNPISLASVKMWKEAFWYLADRICILIGLLPTFGKFMKGNQGHLVVWLPFLIGMLLVPNLFTLLYCPLMEDLAAQKAIPAHRLSIDSLTAELHAGGILSLTYSSFWVFIYYSIILILTLANMAWYGLCVVDGIASLNIFASIKISDRIRHIILSAVMSALCFLFSLFFATTTGVHWQQESENAIQHLDWILGLFISIALVIVCYSQRRYLKTRKLGLLTGWSTIAIFAPMAYLIFDLLSQPYSILPPSTGSFRLWILACCPLVVGSILGLCILCKRLSSLRGERCYFLFCGGRTERGEVYAEQAQAEQVA